MRFNVVSPTINHPPVITINIYVVWLPSPVMIEIPSKASPSKPTETANYEEIYIYIYVQTNTLLYTIVIYYHIYTL